MKSISLLAYGLNYRIPGNFQERKLSLMNFEVFMKVLALFGRTSELLAHVFFAKIFTFHQFAFSPAKISCCTV